MDTNLGRITWSDRKRHFGREVEHVKAHRTKKEKYVAV